MYSVDLYSYLILMIFLLFTDNHSETLITFSTFFNMSFQENVKKTCFFNFEK